MGKEQRQRGQRVALRRLQETPLGALDTVASQYENGELVEAHPYETRIALPLAVELAFLQREWEHVSDTARHEIRNAFADTGIPPSASWAYLVYHHTRIRGDGHVVGQIYVPVPGLPLPLGDPGPWILTRKLIFPWPWERRYQSYRFEVFGLLLQSGKAIEQQPPHTAWIMSKPGSASGLTRFCAIATYRVRIFHEASPVIAKTRWQPGWDEPEVSYSGGALGDDPTLAARGLELFYQLQHDMGGRHRIGDDPTDGELELARQAKQLKKNNPTWTWLRIAYNIGLVGAIEDEGRSKEPEYAALERLRRWRKRLGELGE